MVKSKEGGGGEADKLEGLEIISIGSLYNGSWDKKYWSSSRGKDRYPYPVGYRARRAYNGISYNMEIREGPKGPLFVISSADGNSCSGQTPDIAWEKFQKKGCPRMSIWHGKRFSCKIDGIEFFGFRNPFVQRLLRELVANVDGIAEPSLLSNIFCNGTSGMEHNNQCQDCCTHPDLLTYLERAHVTRKRNKRQHVFNPKLINVAGCKRPRLGNPTLISDTTNSEPRNHSTSVSREENIHLPVQDCLPLILEEKIVPDCGECQIASCDVSNHSADEKPVDRTHDDEMEGFIFPTSLDDKAGYAPSQLVHNVDLYAPDTLDVTQDYIANSAPTSPERSACDKDALIVTNLVISEGLVTESHQEEIATSSSIVSSEKNEFDSVGQEIAKSMMTVLLPQAIPLLKKTSRKTKKTILSLKSRQHTPKRQEENDKNGHSLEARSPATDQSIVPSTEHTKSVIPDSFDNDPCEDHASNKQILHSKDVETYQTSFDKDVKKSSVALVTHVEETCGRRDNSHHDKLHTLNKRPQDGDPYLLESALGSTSTNNKVFQEEKQNVGKTLDENSLGVKILDEERHLKSAPDSKEGNMEISTQLSRMDVIIKAGTTKTDNLSATQVQKKVYTRKKLQSATPTRRKSNALTCRNSGDVCIPETTGTSFNSESFQMTSSDDLGPEARIGGQFHSPPIDTVSEATAKSKFERMKHLVLQTEEFFYASEGNDASKEQETMFCHNSILRDKDVQSDSDTIIHRDLEINNELQGTAGLMGCYFHPVPVSLLLLIMKGNEIYVCALCGLLGDKDRKLILYKLAIEEPRMGYPSFVGHTSVTLSYSTDLFGREVMLERSALQLTPDGQCLVLLGSIRTPYCREGKIDCLCSTCASECFDHSSVKIVHVKVGHVSILVTLRTIDSLQCVLVCEPNHIAAAGDSGRLHLWTMNSTWSAPIEECTLPANGFISPCILELRRIPKCAFLVVGHNGYGEFTIWDISNYTFISRFSSPSTSVHQFFPISLFSWQKVRGFSYSNMKENIDRLMDATELWSSELIENNSYMQPVGEDVAVLLLVSTVSDSDSRQDNASNASSGCQINPVGGWRLGVLVKNMLILGSALDSRAVAIGTSAGHGIIGTLDGLVYMWELSTGAKLGTLHHFKGGSVSCIATDDSKSGILAVADNRGQLLIFRCVKHVANQ